MRRGDTTSRRFGVFLLAAAALHAALLLVPVVRQAVLEPAAAPVVRVRLQAAATEVETITEAPPQTPTEAPAEAEPPPPEPPRDAVVQQAPPPETPTAEPEPEVEPPVISARRILDDLADSHRRDPLQGVEKPTEHLALFRPSLDQVLNEPSVQLPFRDTRIYLVDAYGPGIGGSIDRFFDRVTVPFAFQTKHNTRIECAWILIVAGCTWGDASLYYAADRARKRVPGEG